MQHQEKYGFSYYNLFLKDSNQYIGQAGLYYNYDMTINLCYALLKNFQGMGYATEAVAAILKYSFENLGIKKVTAMSAIENMSSRHLLEKVGAIFIKEKTLFSGMKALCYSIDKDDFYKATDCIKKYKYRKAVGGLLINKDGYLYMFERKDFPTNFQGPEGGLEEGENELQAIYREIEEEIGIKKDKLKLLKSSENYFRYNYLENNTKYGCIGQEKKFFLFEFLGKDTDFSYGEGEMQEFIDFKLFKNQEAIEFIPEFKKEIYRKVFHEFGKFLK